MRSTTRTRIITAAICGVVAFGCAAAAVVLKRPIRSLAGKLFSSATRPEYHRDNEILRFAFTDELAQGDPLHNPPCRTIGELAGQIDALLLDVSLYEGAYERLQVLEARRQGHLFSLPYRLGRRGLAWAYFKPRKAGPDRGKSAALIVPGTGHNQSSQIFRAGSGNYHGDIAEVSSESCDTYVLVKPNEDFLAIHDGRRKLSYEFIVNHLLNRGGSYSARYLVDALAITKHLQGRYERVFLLGLSQGGTAALLSSLQSRPAAVVVASGYSVLSEKVEGAGLEQIVVPGIGAKLAPKALRRAIEASPTRYLFTYGRKETALYRVEAEEHLTAKLFAGLGNVKCLVHDGGHEFPSRPVRQFLLAAAEGGG